MSCSHMCKFYRWCSLCSFTSYKSAHSTFGDQPITPLQHRRLQLALAYLSAHLSTSYLCEVWVCFGTSGFYFSYISLQCSSPKQTQSFVFMTPPEHRAKSPSSYLTPTLALFSVSRTLFLQISSLSVCWLSLLFCLFPNLNTSSFQIMAFWMPFPMFLCNLYQSCPLAIRPNYTIIP